MVRESRARWLAFATTGVVVVLAALFAWIRNPPGESPPAPAPLAAGLDPARLAAGREAFTRLGCARCHAIAGVGNPSTPLDGVGARLDAAGLRDWTLGTGAAAEELSRGVVRAKSRAAEDPDLDALIDYLAQSR
jgi:mono/diheme cytochrome c family protein